MKRDSDVFIICLLFLEIILNVTIIRADTM